MTTSIVLTADQAAKVVGLAPSTLAKLRLNGNGPPYCKLGRRVVYRTEDLGAWLETRIARNTADADARLSKSLTGCLRADEAVASRAGVDRHEQRSDDDLKRQDRRREKRRRRPGAATEADRGKSYLG